MVQINSMLLAQFHQHGLSTNEGIPIDARLIKSASKPVSNEKLNKLREKRKAPIAIWTKFIPLQIFKMMLQTIH